MELGNKIKNIRYNPNISKKEIDKRKSIQKRVLHLEKYNYNQKEFNQIQMVDKIKKIITAVNNESINSLIATPTRGLSVRIGHENNISVMNDCSIVSVPYQIGDDEAGMIAVIGPTRMEYSRVIPLLEYIAKNMSKLFK